MKHSVCGLAKIGNLHANIDLDNEIGVSKTF